MYKWAYSAILYMSCGILLDCCPLLSPLTPATLAKANWELFINPDEVGHSCTPLIDTLEFHTSLNSHNTEPANIGLNRCFIEDAS